MRTRNLTMQKLPEVGCNVNYVWYEAGLGTIKTARAMALTSTISIKYSVGGVRDDGGGRAQSTRMATVKPVNHLIGGGRDIGEGDPGVLFS